MKEETNHEGGALSEISVHKPRLDIRWTGCVVREETASMVNQEELPVYQRGRLTSLSLSDHSDQTGKSL